MSDGGARSPLARRLLIVTGKGGVGKTTIAAALGLLAAGRGARTIVAEVSGRGDVPRMLDSGAEDRRGPRGERELQPRLHHVSIDRRRAMEEYLRREALGPLPAAVLARSRAFELFVAATPGLSELLSVGKAWDLLRPPRRGGGGPYDIVILDAPSTGHALALLEAPGTFAAMARAGPVASQAREIDRMLRDTRCTGVLAVAAAEQMAVSETLDLAADLRERLDVDLDAVVVNGMLPRLFDGADTAALAAADADPAVRSARWLHARVRAQRAHLTRLRRGVKGVPCITLPFLFADELGRRELERLTGALGRRLR